MRNTSFPEELAPRVYNVKLRVVADDVVPVDHLDLWFIVPAASTCP